MKLYPLFVLMAAATVLSPGPGVLMTLSNALRSGLRGTFGGIAGIACGAMIVAALSATSVGVVLAASALAFTILKYIGAAYLFYLGIRLWRSPGLNLQDSRDAAPVSNLKRFREGFLLQFTNPKAIFFFLSIFPQFIDHQQAFAWQFTLLVLTYSLLVMLIHSGYALFAGKSRQWLVSERGGKILNRSGAACFMLFGAALANSRR